MSCSRVTTVDDLSALSDAQLGKFLEEHRRPDGSFELPLEGWNRLCDKERDRLAERLQSIQRAAIDNPTINSHPLDLGKLDSLLRDVSSRDDTLSQDQSRDRERQTESPPDQQEVYKQKEMEAYDNLLIDGGRPLYPMDLMDLVSKDPDAHYEILKPFWRQPRCNTPSERDPFGSQDALQRQWLRWNNFRKWQFNNRGIDNKDQKKDEDDEFLALVEEIKRNFKEVGWAERAAEIEADPTILKQPGRGWYFIQRHRDWQRRYQRELGCKSFSDYEKAAIARLMRYGFTRLFYLAEDLKQQDELTTWIEYLNFEYWWLDRYTASFKRLKPKHDGAWEELKRLKVVMDDETPDFVRTDASGTRCQREEDDAWEAVRNAESEARKVYQKTQKDPNRLSIPKEQRIQMIVNARKRLSAAREALEFAERRSHLIIQFVRGTFDYDDAREDVVNQKNLLEWAVAEALKIEAEQNPATPDGNFQRKRKTSAEDGCLVQSDPKRQKSTARKHSLQPSNDEISTGDARALRRRTRSSIDSSIDMNRQLNEDEGHSIQHMHPSQTNPVGRAAEQMSLIEVEPECVNSRGSSRKRRNVTFENANSTQSSPKRMKPNARDHGLQTSNNGVDVTGRRLLRIRNRQTIGAGQQLNQYQTQSVQDLNSGRQSPGSNVLPRGLTQGLRRSSRLAALAPDQKFIH